MHIAHEALTATGFSEYEARAYCTLLVDSPANGYQIAKRSGIPRSKIYECLGRLEQRGAVVQVESSAENGQLYAPVDYQIIMDDVEHTMSSACARARHALRQLRNRTQTVEVLWRINSQKDLIARGVNLIENAEYALHAALWAEEFDILLPRLLKALDRKLKMSLILYSMHPEIAKLQARGVGAVQHSRIKLEAVSVMGKQFVIVADQQRCIIGSIFPEGDVEGVFTMNRGLVTNAVDLVNHEVYLERILLEVGEPVWQRYGEKLDGLDAFDPPQGYV